MPPWVPKVEMGTLLFASEMPVPIPRTRTVFQHGPTLNAQHDNVRICSVKGVGIYNCAQQIGTRIYRVRRLSADKHVEQDSRLITKHVVRIFVCSSPSLVSLCDPVTTVGTDWVCRITREMLTCNESPLLSSFQYQVPFLFRDAYSFV